MYQRKENEMIIRSIIEFTIILIVIWGLFNEAALIKFEENLISKIKTKIKAETKNENETEA